MNIGTPQEERLYNVGGHSGLETSICGSFTAAGQRRTYTELSPLPLARGARTD